MQHRRVTLWCAENVFWAAGTLLAHEKLLHPAGCRRAGGRARTGGGAGEPPVHFPPLEMSPLQVACSAPKASNLPDLQKRRDRSEEGGD
jgi:hypothetical protein